MIIRAKESWSDGSPMLPNDVLVGIGNLTFEQLSSLRHRGAFSTVSLTFTRCCQLLHYQNPTDSPDPDLLNKWYKARILDVVNLGPV